MIVVLTGGIASGKTFVSDQLTRDGVDVIDADLISREVVLKGSPLLQDIKSEFGDGVIQANGELNRLKLKQLVFSDPDLLNRLNALMHPAIRLEIKGRLKRSALPLKCVVIPLVKSRDQIEWCDRLLVVDTSEKDQIKRLRQRDGVSELMASNIMSQQPSRSERLSICDDIINNRFDLSALREAAQMIHQFYKVMLRKF